MTSAQWNSFGGAFADRRVLVTGHTGFMGSWLCEWLLALGARVGGIGLPPETEPAMFEQLHLADRMDSVFADVRSSETVKRSVNEAQPDFVFHLAGQPHRRRSYRDPLATWQTNVTGSLNLLEALRSLTRRCTVILVTDDCYANRHWFYGYREDDPLGGTDPCSASKAAVEVAVAAWRRSFFVDHPVRLATVRTGSSIGGGDWSPERLVPECARAWLAGRKVRVRNPETLRPWQHVLEPLSGCLWLAVRLSRPEANDPKLSDAFNFSPSHDTNRTVRELLAEAGRLIGADWIEAGEPEAKAEPHLFQLTHDKASAVLGWRPVWSFADCVRETIRWYFDVAHATDPELTIRLTRDQIEAYTGRARDLALPWTEEGRTEE